MKLFQIDFQINLILFDDSTDTESFSSLDADNKKTLGEIENKSLKILQSEFYAVSYDQQC